MDICSPSDLVNKLELIAVNKVADPFVINTTASLTNLSEQEYSVLNHLLNDEADSSDFMILSDIVSKIKLLIN